MFDINKSVDEHTKLVNFLLTNRPMDDIVYIGYQIFYCINRGNKVLICGNGGSASDSQHFAAELQVKFEKLRKGFSCFALTSDTSILTAIGNDYGFKYIFSRQVETIANTDDVLIAITTSGKSENVLEAIETAYSKDCIVICLTGEYLDEYYADMCEVLIKVPSIRTARIQEVHGLILHLVCEYLDDCYKEGAEDIEKL